MTTYAHQWPWKTQEKLTLAFLPLLSFTPALLALAASEPVSSPMAALAGTGVFFTLLLAWTGYTRKAKSQILATLDGNILTVTSKRHGQTTGDLSGIFEARTFQHAVTLEAVLSVRTTGGELRIPARLLTGNPDLAAIVTAATDRPRVTVLAED